MTDERLGQIYEEAYIAACEEVGPNSYEFEAVMERITDKMVEEESE